MKSSNPFENSNPKRDKPISGTEKLNRLQKDIPRANLGKELRAVEDGDLGSSDPSQEALDRLKIEINGLVAFSIQEIWNGIKNEEGQEIFAGFQTWIKENPPGISRSDHLVALDSNSIHKVNRDKSAEHILAMLADATYSTLLHHVNVWKAFHEKRLASENLIVSYSDRAYQRYKDVIFQRSRIPPTPSMKLEVSSHIAAGVATAVDVLWGVIETIPRLYRHYFNKSITQEEF